MKTSLIARFAPWLLILMGAGTLLVGVVAITTAPAEPDLRANSEVKHGTLVFGQAPYSPPGQPERDLPRCPRGQRPVREGTGQDASFRCVAVRASESSGDGDSEGGIPGWATALLIGGAAVGGIALLRSAMAKKPTPSP